ncbi:hypothetical protein BGZ93_000132 [Podila epicladia]|nr:hypothetical protein BGZ93_000132 [Podila epicladia]
MGKISLPADRQRPKKPCRYFMRGRCGKGDKCTYSHDPSLKNKTQNTNSSANSNSNKETFRSRPSLLQMLLSSEIKEEKNMLLEAMRYMVENNFFDRQEPTGALVEEVVIES